MKIVDISNTTTQGNSSTNNANTKTSSNGRSDDAQMNYKVIYQKIDTTKLFSTTTESKSKPQQDPISASQRPNNHVGQNFSNLFHQPPQPPNCRPPPPQINRFANQPPVISQANCNTSSIPVHRFPINFQVKTDFYRINSNKNINQSHGLAQQIYSQHYHHHHHHRQSQNLIQPSVAPQMPSSHQINSNINNLKPYIVHSVAPVASKQVSQKLVSSSNRASSRHKSSSKSRRNEADVQNWTINEVDDWIFKTCCEYGLPKPFPTEKFIMNGKALLMLTKEDFINRSILCGDILYQALLKLKLSMAKAEKSRERKSGLSEKRSKKKKPSPMPFLRDSSLTEELSYDTDQLSKNRIHVYDNNYTLMRQSGKTKQNSTNQAEKREQAKKKAVIKINSFSNETNKQRIIEKINCYKAMKGRCDGGQENTKTCNGLLSGDSGLMSDRLKSSVYKTASMLKFDTPRIIEVSAKNTTTSMDSYSSEFMTSSDANSSATSSSKMISSLAFSSDSAERDSSDMKSGVTNSNGFEFVKPHQHNPKKENSDDCDSSSAGYLAKIIRKNHYYSYYTNSMATEDTAKSNEMRKPARENNHVYQTAAYVDYNFNYDEMDMDIDAYIDDCNYYDYLRHLNYMSLTGTGIDVENVGAPFLKRQGHPTSKNNSRYITNAFKIIKASGHKHNNEMFLNKLFAAIAAGGKCEKNKIGSHHGDELKKSYDFIQDYKKSANLNKLGFESSKKSASTKKNGESNLSYGCYFDYLCKNKSSKASGHVKAKNLLSSNIKMPYGLSDVKPTETDSLFSLNKIANQILKNKLNYLF